jgi:hypothetical protein
MKQIVFTFFESCHAEARGISKTSMLGRHQTIMALYCYTLRFLAALGMTRVKVIGLSFDFRLSDLIITTESS